MGAAGVPEAAAVDPAPAALPEVGAEPEEWGQRARQELEELSRAPAASRGAPVACLENR